MYDLIKKKDEELEVMKFEQKHPNGIILHSFIGNDGYTLKYCHSYRYSSDGKMNTLFLINTKEPALTDKFNISRVSSGKIFITYEDKKWLIDINRNIKMEIPSKLYEYKC